MQCQPARASEGVQRLRQAVRPPDCDGMNLKSERTVYYCSETDSESI